MSLLRAISSRRWWLTYLLRCHGDKVAYLRRIGVRVGDNCSIYTTVIQFGTEPWLIELGNNVTIAGGVTFVTHDGATRLFRHLGRHGDLEGSRFGTIHVRDNCFVGQNALLLPGVVVGPDSIVGAGSVVTRTVLPGVVAAGNPARVLSSIEGYIARFREKRIIVKAHDREGLRSEVTARLWGEGR